MIITNDIKKGIFYLFFFFALKSWEAELSRNKTQHTAAFLLILGMNTKNSDKKIYIKTC